MCPGKMNALPSAPLQPGVAIWHSSGQYHWSRSLHKTSLFLIHVWLLPTSPCCPLPVSSFPSGIQMWGLEIGSYPVTMGTCVYCWGWWAEGLSPRWLYWPALSCHPVNTWTSCCRRQANLYFIFKNNFCIVVQVQLSPFSPPPCPPPHPCLPPSNLPPLALSMGPLYMFLDDPSCSFPVMSLPLPSGHCQFVLYFNVSGYILPACLFCWLGSTYRWDYRVFVFHCLAYFTKHNALQFHPCCCEGRSSFFLSAA